LEIISESQIKTAFKRDDLVVFTNQLDFNNYLFSLDFNNSALLMMSSGNYGNLDFEALKSKMKD
jgi:UDP-N-acetylmuramate: L-alanyl-gamma-D-glutamyl-meso-diaminopimelate ligase